MFSFFSFSTFFGYALGIGLLFVAIVQGTSGLEQFINTPGLFIVVGGTLAASFVSFNFRDVLGAFGLWGSIFVNDPEDHTRNDVKMILRFLQVQRTDGRVAIEQQLSNRESKDPFIIFGLDLLMNNYHPQEIRGMLGDLLMTNFDRGLMRGEVLRTASSYAPAFGMIGTLIGLVEALSSFSGELGQLGAGIALALLTTFYGLLLANLFLTPAAEKVIRGVDKQHLRERLLIEGFVLLAERKGPLAAQDKLNSLLTPEMRYEGMVTSSGRTV